MKFPAFPALAILGLFVLKIASLFAFGPRFEPDSSTYTGFADLILHDTGWWSDAGLDKMWLPVTAFRSIGYPAILAFGQLIAGQSGGLYVVVLIQIFVSLAVTVMVWRVASEILSGQRMALIATVGYALSMGFLYDQSIMTDSLFNSLFVLLFALPAYGLLRGKAPDLQTVILGASFLLLAHAIRGITIYLTIFLLPIWLVWFWAAPIRLIRRGFLLAAFLLPMLIFNGAVTAWNYLRTGQAFYVTNIPVPIQPMVKAAGRGRDVFDGDTPVDNLARKVLKTYSFAEVMTISDRLFSDYGIQAPDATKMEMGLYFRAWRHHPWAMLENGFNNFHQTIAYNFFDIVDTADESVAITTERHLFSGAKTMWSNVREKGDILSLAMIVVTGIGRIGSWFMLALFTFGIPIAVYRAWRRNHTLDSSLWVLFSGWLLFWGYLSALVLLHWVTRFLPAVLPWGLIGSLYVAANIWPLRTKTATAS
jgi:hypothetical protein